MKILDRILNTVNSFISETNKTNEVQERKMKDLEKAVYYLAARVEKMADTQATLHQTSLDQQTTFEEMLNALDNIQLQDEEPDFRKTDEDWISTYGNLDVKKHELN